MAKYRILFDHAQCEGTFVCRARDPIHFVPDPDDDGKIILEGGKQLFGGALHILELNEEDSGCVIEAARGCPTNVLQVVDLDTGESLVEDCFLVNIDPENPVSYDE